MHQNNRFYGLFRTAGRVNKARFWLVFPQVPHHESRYHRHGKIEGEIIVLFRGNKINGIECWDGVPFLYHSMYYCFWESIGGVGLTDDRIKFCQRILER